MALPVSQTASPVFDDFAAGWALLTEAGAAVARLAGLEQAPESLSPQAFAQSATASAHWGMAHRAIDDLAAVLHTGLAAIDAALRDGREVAAAANTLWREYDHARRALLQVVTPA